MKVFKNKQKKLENSQESIIQSLSPGKQLLISTVAKWNRCDGKGFFAITALADATIDVSACNSGILENISGAILDATTDIVIPAGVTIYGKFPEIELLTGSGAVIAYARSNAVLTGEA